VQSVIGKNYSLGCEKGCFSNCDLKLGISILSVSFSDIFVIQKYNEMDMLAMVKIWGKLRTVFL